MAPEPHISSFPAGCGMTLRLTGELEVALNLKRFTPLSPHLPERSFHTGMHKKLPGTQPGEGSNE